MDRKITIVTYLLISLIYGSFLFAETVQSNDVDKICTEIMDSIYNDLIRIKNAHKELNELRYENNVIGFPHGDNSPLFDFPHFDIIYFDEYGSWDTSAAILLRIHIKELDTYLVLQTDYSPSSVFLEEIIEILRFRMRDFTTEETSDYIEFQDKLTREKGQSLKVNKK